MSDRIKEIQKRADSISDRLLYTKGYEDEHAFNLACRDRTELLTMLAAATARANALQKQLDQAQRLIVRWESNKHPQNKDWDDGWDKGELNCAYELKEALEQTHE